LPFADSRGLRSAPSTREVIGAKTSRMLDATIWTSKSVLFKLSGRLDGFKQHSLMTIRTQISGRQTESKFPTLQEQIHTLDYRGTGRQIHPFGFHRQIETPRCRINGCRSPFTRVRRPFKVKTNSGTPFPQHGTNYCFQMGKLEGRLVSLSDSWTFELVTSLSVSMAKASSSWIASVSQFLDSSRNVVLNCRVRAVTANSAQCAAFRRHSLGSPGMNRVPGRGRVHPERNALDSRHAAVGEMGELCHGHRKMSPVLVIRTQVQPVSLQTRSSSAPGAP
jgi:hypothetical protein